MSFDPYSPFDPTDPSQWWRLQNLPHILVQPKTPPNPASGAVEDDGLPNDWFVPEADGFPNDWIYPDNDNAPVPAPTPSAAPVAPSPQPNPAAANPSPERLDPYHAFWAQMPASRAGAFAWHPPIFLSPEPSTWLQPPTTSPNPLGQFPTTANAPPDFGPGGFLSGPVGRMIAEQAKANDPLERLAKYSILGNIPKIIAASASSDTGLSSDFSANRRSRGGLLTPLIGGSGSESVGTSDTGNDAAALTAGTDSRLSEGPAGPAPGDQLAQAFIFGLPPSFFLAEPPVKFGPTPQGFTPLEELPPGSAGGATAGKRFPGPSPYPEGTPCVYCRQPTTNQPGRPNSLEQEHNIPRSRGGDGNEANRLPSCRTCNRQKRNLTPEEFYRWLLQRNNAKEIFTNE
jgi:HNH endonuclease